MKKLPVTCPSCAELLAVSELACFNCDTKISGSFSLPLLLKLPFEDQDFILQFLLTSGSLKKMAVKMGVSYPTVRNRLDDIIETIKKIDTTL